MTASVESVYRELQQNFLNWRCTGQTKIRKLSNRLHSYPCKKDYQLQEWEDGQERIPEPMKYEKSC